MNPEFFNRSDDQPLQQYVLGFAQRSQLTTSSGITLEADTAGELHLHVTARDSSPRLAAIYFKLAGGDDALGGAFDLQAWWSGPFDGSFAAAGSDEGDDILEFAVPVEAAYLDWNIVYASELVPVDASSEGEDGSGDEDDLGPHVLVSRRAPFAGTFGGVVRFAGDTVNLRDWELAVGLTSGDPSSSVNRIVVNSAFATEYVFLPETTGAPAWAPGEQGLTPVGAGCGPGTVFVARKQVQVQLVRYNYPTLARVSNAMIQCMIDYAVQLWNPGDVYFNFDLPDPIDAAAAGLLYVDGSGTEGLRLLNASRPVGDRNAVPVFFVANDLHNLGFGGGNTTFLTINPDTSLAVVVIGRTASALVLAHELGHVLSGLHPDEDPGPVVWTGDADTILGKPPLSAYNTLRNCSRAVPPFPLSTNYPVGQCRPHATWGAPPSPGC
jgi:hypothetical protein